MEERRGQRSGKRLSLRHCHTILPRPCSPRNPDVITSHTSISFCLSFSHPSPVYLYRARLTDRSSCFLKHSIILPLCTYDNEFRFSWSPLNRFPRSISSLTNDRGLIRRIPPFVSVSLLISVVTLIYGIY